MIHRIREKIQLRTVIKIIPTALFLIFLYYMMIKTYAGVLKNTVESTKLSFASFAALTESFEELLQYNIYDKNNYINLNGQVTNLLGINSLNERQKLANGYLAYFEGIIDVSTSSENVIELNEFLSDREIDFLYVLAPSASSIYDVEFAPGYGSESSQNIDAMIETLSEAGVNVIDMDNWFEENGWSTEDVFFVTDHHWRPEAGLAAAKCTMEYLDSKGSVYYNEDWLSDENWTITVWKDLVLGSDGKRTGTKYAGTDDISVYEPNFAVNYSYSGLKSSSTTWEYYDNILDLSYTEETDYFNNYTYMMYMYNDYPIRTTINTEAMDEKRILIMGDSFKMPYEYFLTTQFQEVYTIDLRYYTDGTLAEYIEEIKPDIVIMCTYENSLSNDMLYSFGVDEYLGALETESANVLTDEVRIGDVVISAQEDNDNNFTVLYADLEQNQTYTLTLDSTAYVGGDDLYIQMTLQELSENKSIYNRYFDANSNETQKWIFTTPEDISGVCAIYLYAGTKGHTEEVSAEVTGIKLRKGIFED